MRCADFGNRSKVQARAESRPCRPARARATTANGTVEPGRRQGRSLPAARRPDGRCVPPRRGPAGRPGPAPRRPRPHGRRRGAERGGPAVRRPSRERQRRQPDDAFSATGVRRPHGGGQDGGRGVARRQLVDDVRQTLDAVHVLQQHDHGRPVVGLPQRLGERGAQAFTRQPGERERRSPRGRPRPTRAGPRPRPRPRRPARRPRWPPASSGPRPGRPVIVTMPGRPVTIRDRSWLEHRGQLRGRARPARPHRRARFFPTRTPCPQHLHRRPPHRARG